MDIVLQLFYYNPLQLGIIKVDIYLVFPTFTKGNLRFVFRFTNYYRSIYFLISPTFHVVHNQSKNNP